MAKELIYCEERDKWIESQVDEPINNCDFEDDFDYLMEEFLKGPQYEY